MSEYSRLEEEYKKNEQNLGQVWNYFNPVNVYYLQEYEACLLKSLSQLHFELAFSDLKILDLGCGRGSELMKWSMYGAQASNLFGLDLLEYRIQEAKKKYPQLQLIQSSADHMPYPNESFDLVYQKTVFSSILDQKVREDISIEVYRVLKTGGYFIWYDMRPTDHAFHFIDRFFRALKRLKLPPRELLKFIFNKFKNNHNSPQTELGSQRVQTKPMSLNEVQAMFSNFQCVEVNYLGLPYYQLEMQKEHLLLSHYLSRLLPLHSHLFVVFQKA